MSHFVNNTIATLLLLVPGIRLYAGEAHSLRTLKFSRENARLRDFVLSNPSEASFQKIPWRTSAWLYLRQRCYCQTVCLD